MWWQVTSVTWCNRYQVQLGRRSDSEFECMVRYRASNCDHELRSEKVNLIWFDLILTVYAIKGCLDLPCLVLCCLFCHRSHGGACHDDINAKYPHALIPNFQLLIKLPDYRYFFRCYTIHTHNFETNDNLRMCASILFW